MLRRALLACLALVGFAGNLGGAAEIPSLSFGEAVTNSPGEALAGLPWGASRRQIERLRKTRLFAADPVFLDHYGPPGVPRRELTDFEQRDVRVGGLAATLSFRLRRDALYQVLVEVESDQALASRHDEILAALDGVLGAGAPAPGERDDELHGYRWQAAGRTVRYWMLDDPSSGPRKHIFVGIESTLEAALSSQAREGQRRRVQRSTSTAPSSAHSTSSPPATTKAKP